MILHGYKELVPYHYLSENNYMYLPQIKKKPKLLSISHKVNFSVMSLQIHKFVHEPSQISSKILIPHYSGKPFLN